MTLQHLYLLGVCSLLTSLASQSATQSGFQWVEASSLRVEGQGWSDTLAPFDRLPKKAKASVRPPVWSLSRDSAGILVRFKTDATEIHARWSLTKKKLAMPHMPATGVSGLDLYVHHKKRWRWLGVGMPRNFPDNETALVRGLSKKTREYLLYLPLYNGVSKVSIGIPKAASIKAGQPPKQQLPLVFYGTSITQGGCASRPGMVHTAILGRQLDCEVINLGFSGNGTMDMSMATLLTEIKASAYVIDCLPNMQAGGVRTRVKPLVKALRKAHPNTPIVLVEDRSYANAFLITSKAQRSQQSRLALRKGFRTLQSSGMRGLHYLPGSHLLGDDSEATVDSSHPTDLGFTRQAAAFAKLLAPLLSRK